MGKIHHRTLALEDSADFLLGHQIPEPDGSIIARGNDTPFVKSEELCHRLSMTTKRKEFCLCGKVIHIDRSRSIYAIKKVEYYPAARRNFCWKCSV
jgi:hypothetical protein